MRISRTLPKLARRALVASTAAVLAAGTLPVLAATPAFAGALADVNSVSFKASDPATYEHRVGGGAWNDGSVAYVQGSLQGSDFACGDTVSYLAELNVTASPSIDDFPARIVMEFTADSTGQSGVSLTPVRALVNYGDVGGTGTGGTDAGMADNGNSTIANWGVTASGTEFTSGATKAATFDVTHLQASEDVIVRVDAEIGCQAHSTPTGNLQAALLSVDVIAPGTPHTINTGNQTVNFQTVGNIAGVGEPLLFTVATASSDGSCPGDDPLELDLATDTTVTYCYAVYNYGTVDATTATLEDDNATFADDTDNIAVPVAGGSYPAGVWTNVQRTGKVFTAGTYEHAVTADGANADPSSDVVTIIASGVAPSAPEPVLTKTVVAAGDTCPGGSHTATVDRATTNTVKYCYVVENIGNAALEGVTLVDDMGTVTLDDDVTVTLSGLTGGDLPAGATAVGEHVDEFTTFDHVYAAEATVSGTDGTTPYTATDTTTVTVTDTRTAAVTIEKTVSLDGSCPGEPAVTVNRALTSTVTFCYRITNTGELDIDEATVTDDMGTPADPSDDITIGLGTLHTPDVIDVSIDDVPLAPEDGIYDSGVTVAGTVHANPYSDTSAVSVTLGSYELGAVTGATWLDRNHDGVRQDGEPPLVGVGVSLVGAVCPTEVQPGCGATVTAVTGSDGRYHFAHVPYGAYTVIATAPAGVSPSWDSDGGTPWIVDVTVEAPEPDQVAVADLAGTGTGTLRGRVTVEGTTTPIANAAVVCAWAGPDGVAGTADDASFTTVTDTAGGYAIAELPFGAFTCRFTDPVTGTVAVLGATLTSATPVVADAALARTTAARAALASTGGEAGMLVTGGFALTGIGTVLTRITRRRKRR